MSQSANGQFREFQDRIYGGVSKALRTDVDGIKVAPTFGSGIFQGNAPHVVMSPVTPAGTPTFGAILTIHILFTVMTPAIPVAGGFTVTPWFRNPLTYMWKKTAPVTFATAGVRDEDVAFVITGLPPSEIYFQVAAASVAGDGWISFTLVEI